MKKLLLFAVVAASTQFAQIPDLEFDYIKTNQGYGKIIEFDMYNSPSDIRASLHDGTSWVIRWLRS